MQQLQRAHTHAPHIPTPPLTMPLHPEGVAASSSAAAPSSARAVPLPQLAPLFTRLRAKLQTRMRQQQQTKQQTTKHAVQVASLADLTRSDSPTLCALHDDSSESSSGPLHSQIDSTARMPFEVRSAMSLLSRSLESSMQILTQRVAQSVSAASAAAAEARASKLADRQRAADSDDRFIRLQQQLLFERREGERREDRLGALEATVHSLQQRLSSAPAQPAFAHPSQLVASSIQVPTHRSQHESTPTIPQTISQQQRLELAPIPAAASATEVPARIVPGLKRVQSDKSLFDRLREEAEQSAVHPPPRSQPPAAASIAPPAASTFNPVAMATDAFDSDNDDAPAARWSPKQRSISPPAVAAVVSRLHGQLPPASAPSLSPPLIPLPIASPPPSASSARSTVSPQPLQKAAGKSSAKVTKPKPKPKQKKKARRRISFSQKYDDDESSEDGTIERLSLRSIEIACC